MEYNNTHPHYQHHFKANTGNTTKADRKREQKQQAKEIENFTASTTTNNKQTATSQDNTTTEEEEEEETETSANTATTSIIQGANCFKRFKTSETTHFDNFETTSTSNHDLANGDSNSQGFDVPKSGLTVVTKGTYKASEFISVGERIAALCKGSLISREAQNGRGGSKGLRFKCSNNHEFTISFSKLMAILSKTLSLETCKDIWCVKCHNFYYRCRKKAANNCAVVTSSIFDYGYVTFNCRMNHNFKISVHRNPDKIWCSYCRKNKKKAAKKLMEIDLERKKQQYNEQQRKLFEESRKFLQDEQSSQKSNRKITIQEILKQVELKARYETKKFILTQKSSLSEASVFNIYKTIYMPSEILQASFQSLGEGLNSCFRKMAILVHPDKNSHPLSNRAFQKLSQVYMKCQNMR